MKKVQSRKMKNYIALMLCYLMGYISNAQQSRTQQPNAQPSTNNKLSVLSKTRNETAPMSPGGLLDTVIDRFGNKYSLRQIAIDDAVRGSGTAVAVGSENARAKTTNSTYSSGYFQLYLEDGCGMENYANTTSFPEHGKRLAVLSQVLQDISAFIISPLSGTTTKINIWVRNPNNINAPSNFLGVASSFYNLPYAPSYSGIADNSVWLTMISGQDAYTNVVNPLINGGAIYSGSNGGSFHGFIAFNFSNTIWHTDLTTAPSINEYDLYSVALHEIMHALGFVSLIDSSGISQLGSDFPYYSRYDKNLKTSIGTNLIVQTGSCFGYNFNPSLNALAPSNPHALAVLSPDPAHHYSDSTVCTNAIKYDDGAIQVPVYTPNAWENGSSLSHFEDECLTPDQNNQYFLMANARLPGQYQGAMIRYPKPEERKVLCDIGYNVNSTFGNAVNLNNNNYGGSACNGNQVAGINDGVNSTGYTYISTGGAVTINGPGSTGLLANDYNANSINCLEVVIGPAGGTLSATSGNSATPITYTPPSGFTGPVLLRYIPGNTVTGSMGNNTYVYVWVNEDNCIPSPCDLVMNGGFENSVGCQSIDDPYAPGAHISCWTRCFLTPDIISNANTSCSTMPSHPGMSNNYHFIGLFSTYITAMNSNNYGNEGVQSQLVSPLIPGKRYIISFWASTNYPFNSFGASFTSSTSCTVVFGLTTSPMPWYNGNLSAPPSGITTLKSYLITNTAWTYFSDTFTYTGTAMSNFVVYTNPYLDPTVPHVTYLCLDDISIQPYDNAAFFTLPDSIFTCTSIHDLSVYTTSPGGVFSGSGVTLNNGVYSFYPRNAFNGSSGIATITYTYQDKSGCTHTTYSQIKVVVNYHCCDPYQTFSGSNYTTITDTSIISYLAPGNYILQNSITLTDVVIFDNAVISMPAGVTISVAPGAVLFLESCHLFSCGTDSMWNGIVLQSDNCSHGTGIVFVEKNTLIEDALTAIYVNAPCQSSSDNLIHCDGAIFNRNATGIDVENSAQSQASIPLFSILNTVFTSVDLSTSASYPVAWPPTVGGTNGLINIVTAPDLYHPPYYIVNFHDSACKKYTPETIGIKLINVGSVNGGITNRNYNEISIGNVFKQNLFYRLNYGIYANNANLSVTNSIFADIRIEHIGVYTPGISGGVGIHASSSNNVLSGPINRLRVGTPFINSNRFYNCEASCVEAGNYYEVQGENNFMTSTRVRGDASNFGYKITAWNNDSTGISGDSIINIANAVFYSATSYSYHYPYSYWALVLQNIGSINVNNNVIQATFNSIPPNTTVSQSVTNAITIQNIGSSYASLLIGTNPPRLINANNNHLGDVDNGIAMSNFFTVGATSNSNSITVHHNPGASAQIGISHVNCNKNSISMNTITGTGSGIDADNVCRAILCNSNIYQRVTCNTESNIGRGFEFGLSQPGTSWHDNTMSDNNKGMMLANGFIGQQGNPVISMNNTWNPILATGQCNTYSLNSNTSYSPLYTSIWPLANKGNNLYCPNRYVNISCYVTFVTTPTPASCNSGGFGAMGISFDPILSGGILFPIDQNRRTWIAQFSIWQAMLADSTMADSSVILNDFKNIAAVTRFKYLTDIETSLAIGDLLTAQTLLGNPVAAQPAGLVSGPNGAIIPDLPDANNVVNNYISFYNLYIAYQDSTMTQADSLTLTTLAALCPVTDGNVVYQARALYNVVYNVVGNWSDDWCTPDNGDPNDGGGGTASKGNNLNSSSNIKEVLQHYRLFPNPNDGNITLLQAQPDSRPVKAEVKNIIGQTEYDSRIQFVNGTCQLNISAIMPGLYFILLKDDSGEMYTLKFVKK